MKSHYRQEPGLQHSIHLHKHHPVLQALQNHVSLFSPCHSTVLTCFYCYFTHAIFFIWQFMLHFPLQTHKQWLQFGSSLHLFSSATGHYARRGTWTDSRASEFPPLQTRAVTTCCGDLERWEEWRYTLSRQKTFWAKKRKKAKVKAKQKNKENVWILRFGNSFRECPLQSSHLAK